MIRTVLLDDGGRYYETICLIILFVIVFTIYVYEKDE